MDLNANKLSALAALISGGEDARELVRAEVPVLIGGTAHPECFARRLVRVLPVDVDGDFDGLAQQE